MDVRNLESPAENPISHELASPELRLPFCATVLWVDRSTITTMRTESPEENGFEAMKYLILKIFMQQFKIQTIAIKVIPS